MQCQCCREYLLDDDFRRLAGRWKRRASVCRVCELKRELARELEARRRRREDLAEFAREMRRRIDPSE